MDRTGSRLMIGAAFLVSLLGLVAAPAAARAGLTFSARPENRTILIPGPGEGTIQIEVIAPDLERIEEDRSRLNLALVIDRSGSMAELGKLEYAKAAAHEMIDRLASDDRLAIVAYDHEVQTLLPSRRVGDRRELHAVVDSLYPRGATDLWSGVEAGWRQVAGDRRVGWVNRVMLISDGLANRGCTDRWEMSRRVGRMADDGVSFSTFGVGASFDEELLTLLATGGGGSYYYLEHPSAMTAALTREMGLAARLSAGEVEIVIRLRSGWDLAGIAGYEWRREGDAFVIRLGDLSSGARRSLITRVRTTDRTFGTRRAADVRVRWRDPRSGRVVEERLREVSLELVADPEVHARSYDPEVRDRAAVVESNERLREAARLVDQGRKSDAIEILKKQEKALQAAPASPAVASELKANQSYQSTITGIESLGKDGAAAAQKGIKYRAYQNLNQQ